MTDLYGVNIYNADGSLKLSLSDDIFRTVGQGEIDSGGDSLQAIYYVGDGSDVQLSTDNFHVLIIPIQTNITPGIGVSWNTSQYIYNGEYTRSINMNCKGCLHVNWDGVTTPNYGTCQAYIIYGV